MLKTQSNLKVETATAIAVLTLFFSPAVPCPVFHLDVSAAELIGNLIDTDFTHWDQTPGWRHCESQNLKDAGFKVRKEKEIMTLYLPEVQGAAQCVFFQTIPLSPKIEYLVSVNIVSDKGGELSLVYIQNGSPFKTSWSKSFTLVPGENRIRSYFTIEKVEEGSSSFRFILDKLRGNVQLSDPMLLSVLESKELLEQKLTQQKIPTSISAQVPETLVPAACPGNRHDAINARVKQGNVDLVFIGDSITEQWKYKGSGVTYLGLQGDEGGQETDEGRMWKGSVWDKFYGKRNAVNMGIGGQRTQQILWRMMNGNLDGISPKLAILMAGGNNLLSNTEEEIAAGEKAIVEKLRKKLPNTKILLLAYFPRGMNKTDAIRIKNDKVNEIVSKLADNTNVFYLDIGGKFLNDDGTHNSAAFEKDDVHLSGVGYEIWASAIESTVVKLMGEK
ncbi:MAG: GDSL-type esterase/lipase family protein [Victivallales bacterium]|jgi:beta-glucosidase